MKKLTSTFALFAFAAFLLASCSKEAASPVQHGAVPQGQGGSMARFAISGNYLYTVDNNNLNLFDISTPSDPQVGNTIPLSFGVETIFPYEDKLFIGTQSGMHIMSIQNPSEPTELSHYQHVVSCDPVVTDGRYAYITLRTGTACAGFINELQIVDIQDIASPMLLARYNMVNPKGLGIDNSNLFVCDDGLKMYDASNVSALRLLKHFPIDAFDVIPSNGNLLVIGSDGFYQYQYEGQSLELLSKIGIQKPK